jgi:GNAT superfamily N-acetyltransferase
MLNNYIQIKPFAAEDSRETYQLFYDTVHTINAIDYSKEQLDVWAPRDKNLDDWCASLLINYSVVAINTKTDQIVGFADLEANGYLNRGYVHKNFQRRGVGQLLLDVREQRARLLGLPVVFSDVSITAKPFFVRNHFVTLEKRLKILNDITFIQFRMEKHL